MATARTKSPKRRRKGHALLVGTMNKPLLQFDLPQEIERLHNEEAWLRDAGRSSKTLVKHRDLRIVLIAMKAKTCMHEHKASARISVQTLAGHIRLRLSEQTVDLPDGHLLTLDQCLPHDVEALEDSAFLLTLSWPPEEKIEECKTHQRKKAHRDGE
jgi:quercetin dioxygenase-like cupin family protein